MDLISFKQIKGLELVSTEAYILGNVADIKYNPETWKIRGVRINQSGRFKKIYPELRGKMLIAPSTKFSVGDVFLLNHSTVELKAKMSPDADDMNLVSALTGKKVLTMENMLIGTIESVHLDMDRWAIASLSIHLDKDAHAPLGVKKLLFNKTVSGVQASFIGKVGESVKLKITKEELKKQIIINE